MSDHTSFQLTIYHLPEDKYLDAWLLVREYRLSWDSPGRHNENEPVLFLCGQYFGEDFRCGDGEFLAHRLAELGASFECWEDPKYEYLGVYYAHTPSLKLFSAECDAEGNVLLNTSLLLSMLDDATDLSVLREQIKARVGTPWQDALGLLRTNGGGPYEVPVPEPTQNEEP